MGIKAAREGFTKDEILEILKRNVSLYKNEPEFVDYIVNLALFLIDQRLQAAGGARPPSSDSSPRGIVQMSAEDLDIIGASLSAQPPAPPRSIPPSAPIPPPVPPPLFPEHQGESKPPSIAELRGIAPPKPPSIPPGMAPSFKTSNLSKEPPAQQPPVPPGKQPIPSLRQLNSPGALTPPPDDERPGSPKIQLGDQGRTRVYKVVRSYSAGEGEKIYCPICGSDTGGESKCPNCGHLV